MPKITVEPDYTEEDFAAAIEEILASEELITTRRVADRVGCSREPARQYLVEQAEKGTLRRDTLDGNAVVYLPAEDGLEAARNYRRASAQEKDARTQSQDGDGGDAGTHDGHAPAQPDDERVMFFPSRREIVVHNRSDRTRSVMSQTAHLVDSQASGHMYKVSEADVWNAPHDTFEGYVDDLQSVVGEDQWDGGFESRIKDEWDRAHMFRLYTQDGHSVLEAADEEVFENVAKRKLQHNDHYTQYEGDTAMRLKRGAEADVKELLYEEGYPVIDERRLDVGADLDVQLVDEIELRDYQRDWVDHFEQRKSGVFVGPSGSGKTIAAIGAMEAIGGETLILVPNRELAQQWEEEIKEKTTLGTYSTIGQYHGGEKRIRPVTIATYDTAAMSRHRKVFDNRDWGLVIADECHHAVADTWKRFREIQSVARLGLSATPVRESSDAQEIYTLIGPPVGTDWGQLFADGWVEKPDVEILMVPWGSDKERERYQTVSGNRKLIEAAKNSAKADVVRSLLEEHAGAKTIVFVDWIKQGKALADELDLPFIYGETSHDDRDALYQQFRDGDIEALIISRVGDEGIDLPDAEVAILASTMGSSRSQTGQRAGRTMRPFGDSQVYILLTKGSGEEDWGRESTQYLAEKGIDITKREWSG